MELDLVFRRSDIDWLNFPIKVWSISSHDIDHIQSGEGKGGGVAPAAVLVIRPPAQASGSPCPTRPACPSCATISATRRQCGGGSDLQLKVNGAAAAAAKKWVSSVPWPAAAAAVPSARRPDSQPWLSRAPFPIWGAARTASPHEGARPISGGKNCVIRHCARAGDPVKRWSWPGVISGGHLEGHQSSPAVD